MTDLQSVDLGLVSIYKGTTALPLGYQGYIMQSHSRAYRISWTIVLMRRLQSQGVPLRPHVIT